MSLQLDHAVIAVHDLDTAIQDYRDLGFTVARGGVHANRATHNALITFLNGTYLELLAATGDPPIPNMIDFSVLLQQGEGLVGFALRSDDLDADAARLRAEGFAVGEVIPGERRREDGTTLRWTLALLDGGFAPFLIQDVTPRAWRIPTDPAITTHANRAVGLRAVEIAVRDMTAAWDRYTRLIGLSPTPKSSNIRAVGGVELNLVFLSNSESTFSGDELPDFLKMFGGNVPQAEIEAADPALEPADFEDRRKRQAEKLVQFRYQTQKRRAALAALEARPEVLYTVQIVREQARDDRFTLERTHGVYVEQCVGTPPTRGESILVGLDRVDWSVDDWAADIPKWLRGLASDDAAVRQEAFEMLGHTITHQGSVYKMSFETAPFLIQLLTAPEIEDKVHLISLLEGVVCGYMAPDLYDRRQALMREVLPVYLSLLDHPDRMVRWMIAAQLSLYESDADTLEPVMRARIASDPEPPIRAAWVGALAALWTGVPDVWMAAPDEKTPRKLSGEQTAYLAGLMRDAAQPLTVQYRAARILVKDDPDVWLDEGLAIFYQMMQGDEEALKSLEVNSSVLMALLNVIDALSAHPDQALDWVIAQAQHPSAAVRQHVPYALTQLVQAGQPVPPLIPVATALMRDPSPDVRERAVGFFYHKSYAHQVTDILEERAAHDPSLTVRVVARNALKLMPPPESS